MGATCCCMRGECEDFANPNSEIYSNSIYIRCFVEKFLHVYASLFRRGEDHASSTQGAASSSPMVSLDNSLANVYRSPPRPLPYDVDPRYYRLQQIREKGSHSEVEIEPLRTSDVDERLELLSSKNKWNESTCEEDSKKYYSKSSLKLSTPQTATGFAHIYASSEDEDVCPTCLDDYTPENPRIITKCSHHFHLGCIYEWMERSDNCPVCGKVMDFDETA
ncbi:hypothetical protein ACS0TY_028538 [Phlomoides rotata]